MKVIKPTEISEKMLSLIDDADKELVIVSATNDFEGWEILFVTLKKAIDRGVRIRFFATKDVEYPGGLSELNIQFYYVQNLPAKICLNEKRAIVISTNPVQAAGPFPEYSIMQTESFEELEEVKHAYLSFFRKDEILAIGGLVSFESELFNDGPVEIFADEEPFSKPVPREMQLFYAHFQKTFRRHNLVYNEEKVSIGCTNFPFKWTDFEYAGRVKISFLASSTFDYSRFRNENISEFNNLFRNHKTYWSYPYDSIVIYGDEAANGINIGDVTAQITYMCYLIKEVIKFLQPKETILLATPLFRSASYHLY